MPQQPTSSTQRNEGQAMTITELPFRATTAQASHWMAQKTGVLWDLPRLLENGLIPYVWLDYDASQPALFGDANGGYPAPIFFEDDTRRLAAGSTDVLITITKDVYRIVAQLPPPGIRRELHELRFLKKDLERLAGKLERAAAAALLPPPEPATIAGAQESQAGISKDQVLMAFASLMKINLEQALDGAGGIFGDEGARVKASTKKSKKNAVWNPVTLALGLNDAYRVPMPQLKRAFGSHDFLREWEGDWKETLVLLGK
ncbi:MAG: hypothetical protein ACI802_000457 [Candidatus Paceibacteria bacterium]|jgi:hypothetical protein